MKTKLIALVVVGCLLAAPSVSGAQGAVYSPSPLPAIGQSGTVGKTMTTLSDVSTTTSGSVQNTRYTLNSVTVPANAFGTNGQAMTMEAWGNFAVNANNKDIFITYAAIDLIVASTTLSGSAYYVRAVITRVGANTQRVMTLIIAGTTVLSTSAITPIAAPDTISNVWTIQTRNTAAAATSGTGLGMLVTFANQ